MPQKTPIIKIYAAAYEFATNPEATAESIIEKFDISSVRQLYRIAETAEWHDGLDELNFTGERSFRKAAKRDITRENSDLIHRAKQAYFVAIEQGFTPKKAVTQAAKQVGIRRPRLMEWKKRFNWEAEPTTLDTETDNG